MNLTTKTLLACTFIAIFVGSVNAEIIALYNFEDVTPYASKDTSSVTATDLSVGADMNVGVTAIWLPGIATAAETNNTTEYFRYSYQSLVDDVLFDSDTLTFTVTPGGGESLDFISLTFDGINYTGGAGVSHYIYSTLVDGTIDNSTTDRIGTFLVPGGSNSTWSSFNLDLSAYTDISVATTFRIELFTTGNSGGNWNGIDNITLNANVNSVPEPASLALLGVGGLLIAGRRRRALV